MTEKYHEYIYEMSTSLNVKRVYNLKKDEPDVRDLTICFPHDTYTQVSPHITQKPKNSHRFNRRIKVSIGSV